MLGSTATDVTARAEDNGKRAERKTNAQTVVKVIEIIGTSTESFDDAVRSAIGLATKSVRGVRGADVKHMTVGIEDGAVTEYRVTLKLAFAIEQDDDD